MTVTQVFRDALRVSHIRHVKAEVLDAANALITEIPVQAGSVKLDASSGAGLRSATLTVSSPEFVPVDENSPLAPFGQRRVRLSVGVESSAVMEWCSLGLFAISEVANDRPFGGLKLTLLDLAYFATEDKVEQTYLFPSNAVAKDEIIKVLTPVYTVPPTVVRDDSNGAALGTYIEYPKAGSKRWDIALGMAGKVGCDLYFDDDGALVLHDPDAARPVTEEVSVGEYGVITKLESKVSRVGTINRVKVIFEGQDDSTGVGIAEITTGPLAVTGPFGRLSEVVVENVETATDAAAQEAAERYLARMSALSRTLAVETAPAPHLRPYDELLVTFPNGQSERARIQSVTHGLAVGDKTKIDTRWDPAGVIGPMRTQDAGFLAGER